MQKQVKQFYNNLTGEERGYEDKRWFANEIKKAGYEMTKKSIKRYAVPIDFTECLELGPGHGTWTKELITTHPRASFTLVDLSAGMLGLAKKRFSEQGNIEYFESDFLDFQTEKKFNLFFSIRAIEYIPDKEKMVKKIVNLLIDGGQGFIITKTPKYFRQKLLGRKSKEMHQGQIAPRSLKKLLKQYGARGIYMRPVTMSWPLWTSPRMNLFLHKIFHQLPLNPLSQFFSESYLIAFKKK